MISEIINKALPDYCNPDKVYFLPRKRDGLLYVTSDMSIDELKKLEKPCLRAKVVFYINEDCGFQVRLHWGEFQNALKKGAKSQQEIIDMYRGQPCGEWEEDETMSKKRSYASYN